MNGENATELRTEPNLKDEVLNELADSANVAQFVSFGPGNQPTLRYTRFSNQQSSDDPLSLVQELIELAASQSVNVRSFAPMDGKSREFLYKLDSASGVMAEVKRLSAEGLHTIVNETIDIHDGGVSGVVFQNVAEFAPDDTPRAVEKPGIASLPASMAERILTAVYGFEVAFPDSVRQRIEFSLHPRRQGIRREHMIVWEKETFDESHIRASFVWPNHFSRMVGDKTYGLLIADALDLPVPKSFIIGRRVRPFTFGQTTGTGEVWLRTAPSEPVPGKFTTMHGWSDPFSLLQAEDPDGEHLVAVIAQEGVDATYSGAAMTLANGKVLIEGVEGTGLHFMAGEVSPIPLPHSIESDVRDLLARASSKLDDVRIEWAHDGRSCWILQLQRTKALSGDAAVIVPGTPARERYFPVAQGLEPLRTLAEEVRTTGEGIVLVGSVGITSHFGDILRRARVPSRIVAEAHGTP